MSRKKVAISVQHLQQLKEQVAQTFGKPVTTKPDCVALSEQVMDRTGTYLSESTLRRFFGLVPSASQPSQQTLDTLSQLVGADNWHSFLNGNRPPVAPSSESFQWGSIRQKAQVVTEISLHRVKEGLGLPYEVTVSRPFAQQLLDTFAEAPQTALALYAPSGAGKSTLLAHWVENQLTDTEDIVWLVPGNALSQLLQQGFSLESWVHQSLGISSTARMLRYFHQQPTERRGTMWLIVDNFFFQRIRSDECVDFYRSLLLFIQEVHAYSWFKIVLSVQVPLWQQVIEPLRKQLQQVHCWYTAAETEGSPVGNLPLLSKNEVDQIIRAYHTYYPNKKDRRSLVTLPLHTQELLRNPFLLQLYLTANHSSDSEDIDELSLVELFVREQTNSGPYAYEKSQLIRCMVLLITQQQITDSVTKATLFSEDASIAAYEELLKSGILEESLELKGLFDASKIVRFANAKVLAYAVISYHLEQHDNGVTISLAKRLGRLFESSEVLSEILRWLILLGFREKNVRFLSQFFSLDFLFTGKTYTDPLIFHLVITLGIQLRRHQELREQLWPVYAQHPLGQAHYFEFFVDIDYLVHHHHQGLVIYAEHKQTIEAQLFTNCLFFLKGFLAGNKSECESAYQVIAAIEPDTSIHPTPLGRRFACMLLYEHYYGGGIKSETLTQLFLVEKQIPRLGQLARHMPTYHTLIAEALNWCERYHDAYKLLHNATQAYSTDKTFVGVSFHHQLLMNLATTQLRQGEVEQAKATFSTIKPYLFDVHSRQYNLLNYHLLESLILRNANKLEEANQAYEKAADIANALNYQGLLKNIFPLYQK